MTYGSYKVGPRMRPGFSFIELIVAVLILGLLGAMGFGALQWIGKAKVTKATAELQDVQLAIVEYNANTGVYPTQLSDLVERPADAKIAKAWKGPYLKKEPTDPWGRPVQYQLNPKGSKVPYELYSWGPNGEGATEGIINLES
jgi:general secretion pathway protein G